MHSVMTMDSQIIITITAIELYSTEKERWYKYAYERWKHWLVVCTKGLLEG